MRILGWIYLKARISQAVRKGFVWGISFSVLGGKCTMPTNNAHQLQPEMRGPLFDLFLVTKGTF